MDDEREGDKGIYKMRRTRETDDDVPSPREERTSRERCGRRVERERMYRVCGTREKGVWQILTPVERNSCLNSGPKIIALPVDVGAR